MKRFTLFLATALVATGSLLCNAQQDLINKMMPKPVPKSPNAAALGKFGDYQVSHFTGLPSVSIPIFEAKSGDLSVPITLNYHASGHKPVDIGSWVGLGWSLSTGGNQISRNVNGKPDDEYYLTHPLNPNPSTCNSFYYLQYAVNGATDLESDVFSYSYPGGGGKFIFVNNGTYVNENSTAPVGPAYLFPYAPVLVNRVNGDKYEITDENGVIHRFGTNGSGVTSKESTNAFNGGNPSLHATTAWNLMDIIAPNSNDAINFKYQNVGYATRHDVSHSWVVKDLCESWAGTCPPPTHTFPQPAMNIDSDVNQQGIDEILFQNGMVKFFLSSGQRSDMNTLKFLDRIEIYELFNGVYTRKKTIQFNYTYFTNGAGGNAALKLDAIQFKDASNAVVQNYAFTYFTNSFSWNPTNPNYLNARDFWGFYNGATTNTDLVVQQSIIYQAAAGGQPVTPNPTIGGATNRAVNTLYSKECVLKRIDFGTGGFTEFDFENHKYLNDQSVVTNAGGLRVTKITSKENATGVPIVKTYKYGTGESGVGRALFTSNQLNYMSEQWYAAECDGVNPPPVSYRIRSYHSSFFNVDESSPVVYPEVTEYMGDPATTTNGKIVYEFDAGLPPADMDQIVAPSTKVFRNSFAWARGKLTKKIVYDRLNNKLSESQTQYTMYQQQSKLVGIGAYQYHTNSTTCPGGSCFNEYGEQVNSQTYRSATFTQSSGVLLPTTTVERSFENGNVNNVVTVTTTSQFYQTELQLQQRTVSRSNSAEETVIVNRYPFNLGVNAGAFGTAKGIYLLKANHVWSVPHETYTYLQNTGGTNQRIISAQLTTYRENPNRANAAIPYQIFLFELAEPVPASSYVPSWIPAAPTALMFDSRYRERLMFNAYDASSNILQASKTKDTPVSFQYGYNNFLPVAEIKNAQNSPGVAVEFKLEGFEDLSGANIIDNAAQAQSGRKYYNGDYTISFTKPNTRNYVIEYYYFTSPNWIYISKPYTGPTMALTEGSRIDNIRIRPVDSFMTSYTYLPSYGISSVTDPNGVTTFYEYDTFGRLQVVKDHNRHAVSTYDYHYYKQQ